MQQMSGYKIIEKIGEGGMGSVYLAEDSMLGRKVALKILNPQLTNDAQFTDRFKQEARLQASLVHPNIVTLYNFFLDEEKYCMVMEFAEGNTLKEIIKRTGPIPQKRVNKIFKQLLEGVGYAHSKGIIHRDIKPSNIILDKDDNVKIMDFGIAKIMGDKGLTKTGTNVGTIYYMSPEQVLAKETLDGRTDIYSLGITFYEMLTAKIPLDLNTKSDFEIMKQIVEKEFIDPRNYYPHISDQTVDIFYKCVQKDREKRFSSCAEVISLLNEEIVVKANNIVAPESKIISGTNNSEVQADSKDNKAENIHISTVPAVEDEIVIDPKPEERIPERVMTKQTAIPNQVLKSGSGNKVLIFMFIFLFLCMAGAGLYFFVFQGNEEIKSETTFGDTVNKNNSPNEKDNNITINGNARNDKMAPSDFEKNTPIQPSSETQSGNEPGIAIENSSPSEEKNLSSESSTSPNAAPKTIEEVQYPIISSISEVISARKLNGIIRVAKFGRNNNVALGGDNKDVLLWNAVNNSDLGAFSTGNDQTLCIAFSSDDKYLASGHEDDVVRLWDISTKKLLLEFKEHFYNVTSVAFSPNNRLLASSSDDGFIILWNISDGKKIAKFKTASSVLKSICFTPDGKSIVYAANNKSISVWNIEDGTQTRSFRATDSDIYSMSLSRNGKYVAIGGSDKTVRVFQFSSGKLMYQFTGHTSRVTGVDFSSDSNFLFSCGLDRNIIVWDINTGNQLKSFNGHNAAINSISVSRDGKYLLTGSDDRLAKLWKISYE